jgi:hypothetical protein
MPKAGTSACRSSAAATPRASPGASTSRVPVLTPCASRATASLSGSRKRAASSVQSASNDSTAQASSPQRPSATAPWGPKAGDPGSAARPAAVRPRRASSATSRAASVDLPLPGGPYRSTRRSRANSRSHSRAGSQGSGVAGRAMLLSCRGAGSVPGCACRSGFMNRENKSSLVRVNSRPNAQSSLN